MARDRQRAKQRRRRQAQGPARAGGSRAAAREGDAAALDPDVAERDRDASALHPDVAAPDRGPAALEPQADAPDRDAVAREVGLDDADVAEAGLGDAPDDLPPRSTVFPSLGAQPSIEHASGFADEARLAEAGASLPDEDESVGEVYEDELEPAPDEVEGDLLPESRVDPAVAEESRAAAHARAGGTRRSRARVIVFLGHVWDELRRVQWPDRRQVGQATAVVLGFIVVAGGYLGLLDALWKPLVDAIL